MRILYISNHNMRAHNGVVNKVKAQVNEWSKHNTEVYIFSVVGLKIFDSQINEIGSFPILAKLIRFLGPFSFLFLHLGSILAARKLQPDIVYSRYFLFSPFLTILALNYPLVIEINGNDQKELRQRKLLYFYNELTRNLTFLSTAGLVCVSTELKYMFNRFQKKTLVVPNGINPQALSLEEKDPAIISNGKINVGFSGTANQPWHGLDKILPLLKNENDIHLHLIGIDGENTHNATYYGRVDSQKNQKILNSCSVSISTLALHRASITEASPLKSREYVMLGKRMVYAYDDSDLDQFLTIHPDWFLKIPNTNENVEFFGKEILRFIRSGNRELCNEGIRKLGLEVLAYDKKESRKLEFFKEIINC